MFNHPDWDGKPYLDYECRPFFALDVFVDSEVLFEDFLARKW
jgi:hypothetical protein